MRQRFLPWTAGDRHGLPERVLAPQRGLESIGPVLRLWSAVSIWTDTGGVAAELPRAPCFRPRTEWGRFWNQLMPVVEQLRVCPEYSRAFGFA
jgi:hypothetical protein